MRILYRQKLQMGAFLCLFNFLHSSGITSMQQPYEKNSTMNGAYYDLRGQIVSGERRMKVLDEHLKMWAQYEKHKGTHRQLDKVKPGKRELFEQRHNAELALYVAPPGIWKI